MALRKSVLVLARSRPTLAHAERELKKLGLKAVTADPTRESSLNYKGPLLALMAEASGHRAYTGALQAWRLRYPDATFVAMFSTSSFPLASEFFQTGVLACVGIRPTSCELKFHFSKVAEIRTTTHCYQDAKPWRILLPNDPGYSIREIKRLSEFCGIPDGPRRHQLVMGLNELVNNAIEHGNLGIGFQLKSSALKKARFFDLMERRSRTQPWRSRIVILVVRPDPNTRSLCFSIIDQGRGFDWRKAPDPHSVNNQGRRNGRGLWIARHAFQTLRFNPLGNRVTARFSIEPGNVTF